MLKEHGLLITLLSLPLFGFSTHILGGDITVQHVEADQFMVTMKLFRDCEGAGADLDQQVTLFVYEEGTNVHLEDLDFTMTLGEVEFPEIGEACFTPNFCLEIGNYIETITLPDNPNGLYIVWERCCRSPEIVNISQPDDLGMIFVASIPDPILQNSSPVFSEYPPDGYFCVSNVNVFTFLAEDVDGDSLVYILDNPLYGSFSSPANPAPLGGSPKPHNLADWAPGFSLANSVGGTPAMTVDPVTGLITASPENIGLFAFAILVEEWRDGVKIGEVRREISLPSTYCPFEISPNLMDFSIYNSFDDLDIGAIDPQSEQWTSSMGNDVSMVSNAQSFSGDQSLYTGPDAMGDNFLQLDNQTIGDWTLSFMVYIPSGATGFFSILNEETIGADENLAVSFNQDGDSPSSGTVDPGGINFIYPEDTWFPISLDIDLSCNLLDLEVNSQSVLSEFNYSADLGAINIASINASSGFYIDDLLFHFRNNNPLGIPDFDQSKLMVYPNPFEDVISLSYTEQIDRIVLRDAQGSIILRINNLNDNSLVLDLSEFTDGLYYLEVIAGKSVAVNPIVKY